MHGKNQTRSYSSTEVQLESSLGLHSFSPEAHMNTEAGTIAAA